MSDWAGIKKAINSTIGTDNFKPLDKIIDDTDTFLQVNQSDCANALECFSLNSEKGGKVRCLYFPQISRGKKFTIDFIICVDGEEKRFRVVNDQTDSNYFVQLNFHNFSDLYYKSSDYFNDIFLKGNEDSSFGKPYIGSFPVIKSENPLAQFTYDFDSPIILNKPIEFKNSFSMKMEVINGELTYNSTSLTGFVIYELSD